jgi:hypothetical protein
MPATIENILPKVLGAMPLGGELARTEPGGACPAPVAIVGLYPAVTRTQIYTCVDGTKIKVPVAVEARSFEGSASAMDLAARYLDPLRLAPGRVFLIDLYPYYLANTAVGPGGRTMAGNVKRYERETGVTTAITGRPKPDSMIDLCRKLPGNAERLSSHFEQCRPALVLTLGNEVAAYVRGYTVAKQAQQYLYEAPFEAEIFGVRARVVHCAHPGVFIRQKAGNPWVRKHEEWCAGDGRALVDEALASWRPGESSAR